MAAPVAQAHRRGLPSCSAAETQAALSRVRRQQCPAATKTATVGGSLEGLYPEAHRCYTPQAPSTTWQPPSHKRTAADRHHVQQQRHKLHCPACGASNAPRRRRQRLWAARAWHAVIPRCTPPLLLSMASLHPRFIVPFSSSSLPAVHRTRCHPQRRRCGSAAVRNGTRC